MIKTKDSPTLLAIHLQGLPGLSRAARDVLLQRPPATVAEALRTHGVRRKTTKRLLALGLLADPAAGSDGGWEMQLLLAGRLGYHPKNSADAALALHAEVERMLDAHVGRLKARISAEH